MAIKEALQKSLWFLNTFKLDIQSFVLSSQISQQSTTIQLSSHTGNSKNTYPSPEHIDEVLFLLDSYGISDEFYHELSMVHPSLPRSYLVKQRRTTHLKMKRKFYTFTMLHLRCVHMFSVVYTPACVHVNIDCYK